MMEENDQELIEIAKALISKRYEEDPHHIAAALRKASGKIFTGVHLEANVGRIAVCDEAVAIGAASTGGDSN